MATKEATNRDGATQKKEEELIGPKPLPYLFEKEIVQKQAKHFWICEHFKPIAVAHRINPIERKLNSWHEQKFPIGYTERFLRYTEPSQRTTQHGLPLLESNVYGWLPKGLSHDDGRLRELNFIEAPKLRCDLTIYGEKLNSERITERPDFNGLRFFLR